MKIEEIKLSYHPNIREDIKVNSSDKAYQIALDSWNADTIQLYEEFKLLLLNRNNILLGIYTISKGGVSGTVVDPKIVFGVAIKSVASSVILLHNHPSGNLNPSEADLSITKKLVEAGKCLEVKVLDHIILSDKAYYSFADNGCI